MTANFHQSRSLSISVFEPLITGTNHLFDIGQGFDAYSQEVRALGGMWAANIAQRDRQSKIEDWIAGGLGRHIVVYDDAQQVIFEGFVNKISANLGPLSVERGPLLDVSNKIFLVYSTVDTAVSPPILGVRARTSTVEDTDSQDKYGIFETPLSSGGVTSTEADEIINTFIVERAEPQTSQSINIPPSAEPSVSLEILGYVHWLFYPYNQTANTGTQNLSDQLEDILTADPNGIISTDYAGITANTLPVKRYENDDSSAWGLIKSLVAQGDASDNRYIFGIYQDRKARYEAIPTTLTYQQRLQDPQARIETLAGQRVLPWNVLPGKWLLESDFLIGQPVPATLREDQRAVFIESAQYSSPWNVTLHGGRVDTLSQKLAKLGLAGVGA
jgi:hypothetical protein